MFFYSINLKSMIELYFACCLQLRERPRAAFCFLSTSVVEVLARGHADIKQFAVHVSFAKGTGDLFYNKIESRI